MNTKQLFADAFADEIEKRKQASPSFAVEDFTATGKAKAEYGGKKTKAYWDAEGYKLVDNWLTWRKNTRWEIWETPTGEAGIEIQFNILLPGDIPVKGFIDRVFVTPSGQTVVVDLKTGRTPETAEQLGLYAVALRMLYGVEINFGYFWDANKASHGSPLYLGNYTPEWFANLYQRAINGINAGAFLPNAANNCGAWCGMAHFCSAVGGAEAPNFDPLLQPPM